MKTLALRGLFLSVLMVGAGYATALIPAAPTAAGPWLVAVGTAGSLISVMAIGAEKDGRLGTLGPIFLVLFAVLAGGLGAPLVLDHPPATPGSGLILGLPPDTAVIVYGVGLLPVLVVPLAYALTFRRSSLGEREWHELRETGRRDGGGEEPPGGSGPRSRVDSGGRGQ